MDLTFLGTGAAMPDGRRVQTGALLDDGSNPLLVDCGSGVLHRLAASETAYTDVDTVLLTHHHLDHVSDLLNLATARWLAGEPETQVVGPPGTEPLLDTLLDAFAYLRDEPVTLPVREIDAGEGPHDVAGYTVRAHPTTHSVYTLAYRFDDRLTIGADSEADPDLIEFAADSDVLVHDCSFTADLDVDNHANAADLGAVLSDAVFETVYLTHLYPMTNGHHEDMLASIAEHYDGTVEIPEDGTTVSV
ncbi:MAG: MBL fold metallo-hydrolase [Halobacteriaceae archaeon]